MPVFFNRNLDPFAGKNLVWSWSFTQPDASGTLVTQQNTYGISNVTKSDGYEYLFDIGTEYDYNFFKPNNTDVCESDVLPYSSYTNLTFFMRVDCTLADDSVAPKFSIIGSGDTSSLTLTISYVDANTAHILFEMYDASSNPYTLSSDVAQGVHSVAMLYEEDDYEYVDLYLDGSVNSSFDLDDYLNPDNTPIHFENLGSLGVGISDIQFYGVAFEDDNPVSQLHSNSFFKPAARTLDPFSDGSLVTSFRGVNNSHGDDQLQHFLSYI